MRITMENEAVASVITACLSFAEDFLDDDERVAGDTSDLVGLLAGILSQAHQLVPRIRGYAVPGYYRQEFRRHFRLTRDCLEALVGAMETRHAPLPASSSGRATRAWKRLEDLFGRG